MATWTKETKNNASWGNEQKLGGSSSIPYNFVDTTVTPYFFLIDNTFSFLIDDTYKLDIGRNVPTYNDSRYSYNGHILPTWDTKSKSNTTWANKIKS